MFQSPIDITKTVTSENMTFRIEGLEHWGKV